MPADIVVLKSQQLGLKPEVKKAAELIAKNFTKYCIEEGKKPATIAGVSFFMAITNFGDLESDSDKAWHLISNVVRIGVPTLKECYQSSLAHSDKLIPEP